LIFAGAARRHPASKSKLGQQPKEHAEGGVAEAMLGEVGRPRPP